MQHMKNKNGFTIIELIMVMIIIGVLAAVAIPRFQDIVVESEVAVEQRVINTIYNGLETYAREKYIDNFSNCSKKILRGKVFAQISKLIVSAVYKVRTKFQLQWWRAPGVR